MNGSIRIGTIRGIPLYINITWLLIFFLFLWSFATSYYPQNNPQWTHLGYLVASTITTVLFFTSIVVHEFGHALVAERFAIHTRRITLLPIGGLAEIESEPHEPHQELLVAIAGPLTSLLLGGFFLVFALLVEPINAPLSAIDRYLGTVNIALALFNLIPAFPMDGGRVLRALVWQVTHSFARGTLIAAHVGSFIAYAFIVMGVLLLFSGAFVNGILLGFIGLFVLVSAQASEQEVTMQQELRGVMVGEVMSRDFATVQVNMTLTDAVRNAFLAHNTRTAAVQFTKQFVGLLTLSDLLRIPKDTWEVTKVQAAMIPVQQLITVRPTDPVLDALQQVHEGDVNQLPVIENGQIVGILTRNDLLRFLQLHVRLHATETSPTDRSARPIRLSR